MSQPAFPAPTSANLPRRAALKVLAAGAASIALPALAAWPDKPIKIVVTFPAGGASDIVARVMAEQLGKKLGQAVVVENRPGAGGSVGGLVVAQAPTDGYTLMLSNSTPISIGPFAARQRAASSTVAIVAPRRGWRTTRACTMPSRTMSWIKAGPPNTFAASAMPLSRRSVWTAIAMFGL